MLGLMLLAQPLLVSASCAMNHIVEREGCSPALFMGSPTTMALHRNVGRTAEQGSRATPLFSRSRELLFGIILKTSPYC